MTVADFRRRGNAEVHGGKTSRFTGSLSVANGTYPPAQTHPLGTVLWNDGDWEATQDGLSLRCRRTGAYIIEVETSYAQANYSDHQIEMGLNGVMSEVVNRYFLFNVASGAPINDSFSLVRPFNEGDLFALRTYQASGGTRTLTYTVTMERLR